MCDKKKKHAKISADVDSIEYDYIHLSTSSLVIFKRGDVATITLFSLRELFEILCATTNTIGVIPENLPSAPLGHSIAARQAMFKVLLPPSRPPITVCVINITIVPIP